MNEKLLKMTRLDIETLTNVSTNPIENEALIELYTNRILSDMVSLRDNIMAEILNLMNKETLDLEEGLNNELSIIGLAEKFKQVSGMLNPSVESNKLIIEQIEDLNDEIDMQLLGARMEAYNKAKELKDAAEKERAYEELFNKAEAKYVITKVMQSEEEAKKLNAAIARDEEIVAEIAALNAENAELSENLETFAEFKEKFNDRLTEVFFDDIEIGELNKDELTADLAEVKKERANLELRLKHMANGNPSFDMTGTLAYEELEEVIAYEAMISQDLFKLEAYDLLNVQTESYEEFQKTLVKANKLIAKQRVMRDEKALGEENAQTTYKLNFFLGHIINELENKVVNVDEHQNKMQLNNDLIKELEKEKETLYDGINFEIVDKKEQDYMDEYSAINNEEPELHEVEPEIENLNIEDLEPEVIAVNNKRTAAEFQAHITGIKSYIDDMKNREPGFIYDNIDEFNALEDEFMNLEDATPEIIAIMDALRNDINIIIDQKLNPVRTPEEEEFYRHIVGINSYIFETKANNPEWVFDNIAEYQGLVQRAADLKTKDNDILSILDSIGRDILVCKDFNGFDEATKNAIIALGGQPEVSPEIETGNELVIIEDDVKEVSETEATVIDTPAAEELRLPLVIEPVSTEQPKPSLIQNAKEKLKGWAKALGKAVLVGAVSFLIIAGIGEAMDQNFERKYGNNENEPTTETQIDAELDALEEILPDGVTITDAIESGIIQIGDKINLEDGAKYYSSSSNASLEKEAQTVGQSGIDKGDCFVNRMALVAEDGSMLAVSADAAMTSDELAKAYNLPLGTYKVVYHAAAGMDGSYIEADVDVQSPDDLGWLNEGDITLVESYEKGNVR